MKNKERQKSLDKKKYLLSAELGKDLSGNMTYCERCNKQTGLKCTATQDQRERECLCAKAYNRLQRG